MIVSSRRISKRESQSIVEEVDRRNFYVSPLTQNQSKYITHIQQMKLAKIDNFYKIDIPYVKRFFV